MADCFLDTNVLLYAVSTEPAEADKTRSARGLLQSADWTWSREHFAPASQNRSRGVGHAVSQRFVLQILCLRSRSHA